MQILHPFAGSIQQYSEAITDPDRHRPDHCPQCAAQLPLMAHGFYTRTVTDVEFDGAIRVRRYLCHDCKRTVSLLPEFALPYLRFSILVISLFLVARLLNRCTLQAAGLCAALAALAAPVAAPNFITRALHMCQAVGWTAAHRFLFSGLRAHLLGWPRFLVPDGRRAALRPAFPSA